MCVACEEDQTPHGVLPASIADVELGQTDDVRPGQPMTASIVLPTGGENLRSVEYYWRNGEEDLWARRRMSGTEKPIAVSLPPRSRESMRWTSGRNMCSWGRTRAGTPVEN